MTMPHTNPVCVPRASLAVAAATVANVVPYAMLAPLVVVRLALVALAILPILRKLFEETRP